MWRYSIEPITKKHVKWYGSLSLSRKYEKQLLDTGLDAVKTTFKSVVYKAVERLGNYIADKVTKTSNDDIAKPDENLENVKEIIIPPEKRDEILNKLRKILEK